MLTCPWTFDSYHGYYETGCEGAFCLESGTPAENRYAFCPQCGERIEVVEPKPEEPELEE